MNKSYTHVPVLTIVYYFSLPSKRLFFRLYRYDQKPRSAISFRTLPHNGEEGTDSVRDLCWQAVWISRSIGIFFWEILE